MPHQDLTPAFTGFSPAQRTQKKPNMAHKNTGRSEACATQGRRERQEDGKWAVAHEVKRSPKLTWRLKGWESSGWNSYTEELTCELNDSMVRMTRLRMQHRQKHKDGENSL